MPSKLRFTLATGVSHKLTRDGHTYSWSRITDGVGMDLGEVSKAIDTVLAIAQQTGDVSPLVLIPMVRPESVSEEIADLDTISLDLARRAAALAHLISDAPLTKDHLTDLTAIGERLVVAVESIGRALERVVVAIEHPVPPEPPKPEPPKPVTPTPTTSMVVHRPTPVTPMTMPPGGGHG